MNFLKHYIYIHPLTIPFVVFISIFVFEEFYILYFFVLCHELIHLLTSLLLQEQVSSFRLLPTGCILSLQTIPCGKKAVVIFAAGPLFNLAMYLCGIFPRENLSLALFNMMPVLPLDGGCILSILCPRGQSCISLFFIAALFFIALYFGIFPIIPAILFILFIFGEKNRLDKTISSKLLNISMSKDNVFIEKTIEK